MRKCPYRRFLAPMCQALQIGMVREAEVEDLPSLPPCTVSEPLASTRMRRLCIRSRTAVSLHWITLCARALEKVIYLAMGSDTSG